MYRTVGNMIETLAQKHHFRVEIYYGSVADDPDWNDDYFYVTVYNRETGRDEGWNYASTLFGALDYLVSMKERGE